MIKAGKDFLYNLVVVGGKDELVKFKAGDEITDANLLDRLTRFNPGFLDIPLNKSGQIIKEKAPEEVKKVVKVIEEEKETPKTAEEFKALTKNEQIELMEKYGMEEEEIKFERYEKDRINKLLELQKEQGVI